MGQKESKLKNYESDEMIIFRNKVEKEGPSSANKYLEDSMNRWKTEKVKFAVSGCSATGKSTFINTLRGVKRGDRDYAEVGFGDTTMKVTPYADPDNPKIVYYDLPGVGTLEVKKENYINEMKICDYDFIFIFFDKVISEDNLWLVGELDKLGIPFSFVRSKIDEDIANGKRDNMDEESVISCIRDKVNRSIKNNIKLANAKNIFFISCVDKSKGELSELIDYVNANLDDFKRLAALSSMAVLSEGIINLKYKVLKNRIKKVSVGAAAIAAIPIPGVDIALNIALLVEEMSHYINFFGLSNKKMKELESFDTSQLKCRKILIPGADMAVFVTVRLGSYISIMAVENVLDLFLPILGSAISGATAAAVTYNFLNSILKDIRDDANVVYKHIWKTQSNSAT